MSGTNQVISQNWSCRGCLNNLASQHVQEDLSIKFIHDTIDYSQEQATYGEAFKLLTGEEILIDEPVQFCNHCSDQLASYLRFRSCCQQATVLLEKARNQSESPQANEEFELHEIKNSDEETEEVTVEFLEITSAPMNLSQCSTDQSSEHCDDFVQIRINEKVFFECQICKSTRKNKYLMRVHVNSHTKPFKCGLCDKTFATFTRLKTHQHRDHQLGPILACNLCEYKTRAEAYLRKHIRLKHEGKRKKTQTCETCGARFFSPVDLLDHQRRHSDLKEFSCAQCDTSFKTKRSLLSHQAVHQELKYDCPVCLEKFLTNKKLRRHVKRHHPDYELPPPGTVLKAGYQPEWMKALKTET